jgi:hypothetical protein
MSFFAIGAGVVTLAGAGLQAASASKAATSAAQMGDYNAKVDIANALQTSETAAQNVRNQRIEDQSFLSGQRAQYAASGVLSGTGSAMQVQATTAGRMEQNIQQYWQDENAKINQYWASAQVGIYQGEEQASTDHLEGAADIFKGIGTAASILGGPSGLVNKPAGAPSGGGSGGGGGAYETGIADDSNPITQI